MYDYSRIRKKCVEAKKQLDVFYGKKLKTKKRADHKTNRIHPNNIDWDVVGVSIWVRSLKKVKFIYTTFCQMCVSF